MKRNAYLLIFDGLADWEPAYALCALARSGKYQIITVGLSKDAITTLGGLRVLPDITLSDVEPAEAAIFILPGGEMWEQAPNAGLEHGLRNLLKRLHAEEVLIGAVCGATLEVARAGLTRHTRHTSNAVDYLKAMVPEYQDQAHYASELAVSDNHLITAGAIGGLEFAREVMKQLRLQDDAETDAWYALFKHGVMPPQYVAQPA